MDSPKTEQSQEGLAQITDNVHDSGQTFVFDRFNVGEQVDEKPLCRFLLCMPISAC
jgi:hypothetical protein